MNSHNKKPSVPAHIDCQYFLPKSCLVRILTLQCYII